MRRLIASAPLSAGDRDRDILVIRMNHSNAGFFAQVQFAINQIRFAEVHGMTPVVHYGSDSVDGPNAFYESAAGTNVWEYYFEPVAGLTLDQARELVRGGARGRLLTLNHWELWRLHHWEARSVFTYPYGYFREVDDRSTYFDDRWWATQRARGRRLVRDYVRVRPEIAEKVDRFVAERFGPEMLGVHIRGTDKHDTGTGGRLARIVPPEEYFPLVDDWLDRHPDSGVFLATDQMQFRDEMAQRYGARAVWYAELLSSSDINVFQMHEGDGRGNRAKGEEVLIDALLLARCAHLLKCTSAVGEFAQYFAESLPSTDLNFAGVTDRPRPTVRRVLRHSARQAELTVRRAAAHISRSVLEDADAPAAPSVASPRCLPSWSRGSYPGLSSAAA